MFSSDKLHESDKCNATNQGKIKYKFNKLGKKWPLPDNKSVDSNYISSFCIT